MDAEESKPTAPSDDVKRKFREALDKKNQQQREGNAHYGDGDIQGAHGKADTQQPFRRKSG